MKLLQSDRRDPISNNKVYLITLISITAAYCVWVLSLPVFPTQDGPMHLYYVHIMQTLLGTSPSIYKHYYYIKHYLPPYSLYYYTLMGLMKIVPALVADKIVICIYFILFTFGFRYLAIGIGPSGHLMSLFAPLLLLNWVLGMGFVNYLLSLALAMWAIGLWWRASGTPNHRQKIAFVVLVYLAMWSHPVPLVLILGFGFAELGTRVWRGRRERDRSTPNPAATYLLQDAAYLLLASGTLLYVKAFTVSDMFRQTHTEKVTIHTFADNAWAYAFQYCLDMFFGPGLSIALYRVALCLALLFPIGLALWQFGQHWKRRIWTIEDTWLALSLLLIVVLPFLPNDMNSSHFLAYRLVVVAWLAGIAAGSAFRGHSRVLSACVLIFSVAGNVLILTIAHAQINPIAQNIIKVERFPYDKTNQVGLVLAEKPYVRAKLVTFDPYLWAAAHYFRSTDSILYNSPWLKEPTIPLGSHGSLSETEDDEVLKTRNGLRDAMASSTELREEILPKVNFVFINRAAGPSTKSLDPVLKSDYKGPDWVCGAYSWFDLCSSVSITSSR